MTIETVASYLSEYGLLIIFLALFCGIVGIPAPEESFLVLIGVMCIHNEFSLLTVMISAITGTITGMIVAYVIGYLVGNKVVKKCGRFIGLTEERWAVAQIKYKKGFIKTIILGLYLPGLRQINPYFAGATRIRPVLYVICSIIGSVLWVLSYIFAGYIFGQWFDIPLKYVTYLGFIFLALFLGSVVVKTIKNRRGEIT